MIKVSDKFLARLKLHDLPAYKLAQQADVNPVTLSKLINGIESLRPNDERIGRIAEILGLPLSEAFEDAPEGGA
jgi:transcriptional regulator with XRE-family HTH domain